MPLQKKMAKCRLESLERLRRAMRKLRRSQQRAMHINYSTLWRAVRCTKQLLSGSAPMDIYEEFFGGMPLFN